MSAVVFVHRNPSRVTTRASPSGIQCTLEYLNEGGANIVFQITPKSPDDDLSSKLLRLHKDLPHAQSARDQLRSFQELLYPLFEPENLIQPTLIELDNTIAKTLNASLNHVTRPSRRKNDFLPLGETHGLSVLDMTPQRGETLLQFKPKWLALPPGIPDRARRCRTCAQRARRAAGAIKTATDLQETCPLALIHPDLSTRTATASALTSDPQIQQYLIHGAPKLLQRLKSHQLRLDPKGVLEIDLPDQISHLCQAMTLRDCTLLVKRTCQGIDARLVDLDLKQPQQVEKWEKVELDLRDGGWYTATENPQSHPKDDICLLSKAETV